MRCLTLLGGSGVKGALTCLLALVWLACTSGSPRATDQEREQALARASAIVDEGYRLKQRAENRAALAKFVEACDLLERSGAAGTPEVASCLDDQASVHVRTGNYEQAKRLYYDALRIASNAEGTDPLLLNGIRYRIGLLGRLEQQGVRCSEPAAPEAGADLPYFPDIAEMQRALGALGPRVHSCASGAPRPVTLKVTITGDGKPIMAEARGADAGTRVGDCVENRISRAIPGAALPRFRACFRAFTYPFPVGDIPRPASEPAPQE
jgi:hypothetical protein